MGASMSFNGFEFGTGNYDLISWQIQLPESIVIEKNPGADVSLNPQRLGKGPAEHTLSIGMSADSETEMRSLQQSLSAAFNPGSTSRLYFYDDQYFLADKTSINPERASGQWPHRSRITVHLKSANPFHLYETTPGSPENVNIDVTSTSMDLDFSCSVSGTAPVRPIITVTGVGDGLRFPWYISNSANEEYMTWASSLSSGDYVVIDCERRTVLSGSDASNAMSSFDGDIYSGGFMQLEPGVNVLNFWGLPPPAGNGRWEGTIQVTWIDRDYYS